MLITSGKIRISTNLPISLCRHLRISLYLQPLVNKNKTKKSKNKKKKSQKKTKFNIRCSKYSRQIVSPGSAHIPRNCGHPTMDSGNLKTNENQYQQGDICLCPCQQEHVDIHTAFKLIKLTRRCAVESAPLLRPPLQMKSQTRLSSFLQPPPKQLRSDTLKFTYVWQLTLYRS